jgi:hypothetical protein
MALLDKARVVPEAVKKLAETIRTVEKPQEKNKVSVLFCLFSVVWDVMRKIYSRLRALDAAFVVRLGLSAAPMRVLHFES